MILYLHGFRSSPQSYKARRMADAMAARGQQADWACPQLPIDPREAMALAEAEARRLLAGAGAEAGTPGAERLTLIGSSLGGYYATWLAEQLGCRAVLLNPVVHAVRDLATQVGDHTGYHDGLPMRFGPEHVEALRAFVVARISRPARYYLIAATGDDVLDWREMRDHYAHARQRIVEGSDHGLTGFDAWLPEILAFADAPPSAHA